MLALIVAAWPAPAQAHALLHRVVEGQAVTVQFYFPDDDRPLFEPYQVFAPGAERPFQSGRVNTLGEVTFRPDRPGEWRVEVVTADGHGTQVGVAVGELLETRTVSASASWLGGTLSGLGWLLGAFGLLALWRLRRAGARTG
jgi:nickel transport protein